MHLKILQAAFLSALVGPDVAQAAAQAAVRTLSEVHKTTRIKFQSFSRNMLLQGENDRYLG